MPSPRPTWRALRASLRRRTRRASPRTDRGAQDRLDPTGQAQLRRLVASRQPAWGLATRRPHATHIRSCTARAPHVTAAARQARVARRPRPPPCVTRLAASAAGPPTRWAAYTDNARTRRAGCASRASGQRAQECRWRRQQRDPCRPSARRTRSTARRATAAPSASWAHRAGRPPPMARPTAPAHGSQRSLRMARRTARRTARMVEWIARAWRDEARRCAEEGGGRAEQRRALTLG